MKHSEHQKSGFSKMYAWIAALSVLLIVMCFQACGSRIGFNGTGGSQGQQEQPENGQGYGGMRSLSTVAAQEYKATQSGEIQVGASYYRYLPGYTCESGSGPVLSHAGLVQLLNGQPHILQNQCQLQAPTPIYGVEVPSYNPDFLGYGRGIFEARSSPPDLTTEVMSNYAWCRTLGSHVAGTDVIIRRKQAEPDSKADESLSLDMSKGPLDPRIQFRRDDAGRVLATYFDATGVLRRAAPGAPRFDHDPVTLRPLGLLVEEGRTNIVTQSEQLDRAPWVVSGAGLTVDVDQIEAPDAVRSAEHLRFAAGSSASIRQDVSGSVTAGARYSLSLWARTSGSIVPLRLGFADATGGERWTSSGFDAGNGWRRFDLTATFATATGAQILIGREGLAAADVFVWGVQLERGNIPTSYIATAGAPQSRAADNAVVSDLSWLTQGQGTFMVEFSIPRFDNDNNTQVLGLRATDVNGRIGFYRSFQGSRYFWVSMVSGGNVQYSQSDNRGRIQAGVLNRAVLAYKDQSFQSAINGLSASATSGRVFTDAQTLHIGSWNGEQFYMNGHIRTVKYWRTVKAPAEVLELSYPLGKILGSVVMGASEASGSETHVRKDTAPIELQTENSVSGLVLRSPEYKFHLSMEPRQPGSDKVNAVFNTTIDEQPLSYRMECRIEDSQ